MTVVRALPGALSLAGRQPLHPPAAAPHLPLPNQYLAGLRAQAGLARLEQSLQASMAARQVKPVSDYQFRKEFHEPDHTRIPGYTGVTPEQWRDVKWQRKNSVKDVAQLKKALGPHLTDAMVEEILRDQRERATMSLLLPPQILNTMDLDNLQHDPIRRAFIPFFSDRRTDWPSHPMAKRDSLHEAEMWVVPGLTWRYTEKALAELIPTCSQYCGYCTRMDVVGNDVPQVKKHELTDDLTAHRQRILDFLRNEPRITDVVVSGGDIANVPIAQLEEFVGALLDMDHIRDIRLATKGFADLPQHFLQDNVKAALARLAQKARQRGVNLVLHTHITHAQSVTPMVKEAAQALLDMGFRDVRNQTVLLAGVNDSTEALLDLMYAAYKFAGILPYYIYMCDMIPNAEHWRVSLARAQELQMSLMGRIAGFATPRILCDVPEVGKRWTHQADGYDRTTGISFWTKNDPTSADLRRIAAGETTLEAVLSKSFRYYDPIHTLPPEGQAYWEQRIRQGRTG